MNPILFLFFFVFVTLAASPARAELGDNLQQCRTKYGDPVDRKLAANLDEMVLFKKDGLKIGAGMKDDKCVILILGKDAGEKLTDEEIEAFLKENGGGSVWKKTIAASGNEVWSRADHVAVAQLNPMEGILTLVDARYMKAQMAANRSVGR